MALSTLHWRMLAPVQLPAGTSSGLMDAIYQMGTATTYADGTARAPGTFASPGTASLPASLGTGSAWTWNYDATTFGAGKTACYGYAPTTTAINQAVIVGATSNITGAAWKQLVDGRAANYLYGGTAKNGATYTSWNNATTPFTSGDFTGFTGVCPISTSITYVMMWESEEAVVIQLVAPAAGVYTIILGAFIDPLSANTANAETDGRLYGVASSGHSAAQSATWLSTAAANQALLTNNASNGGAHAVTFTPGAGTTTGVFRFGDFTPASTLVARSGDIPQLPFQTYITGGQYMGQLRQMNIIRDGLTGDALQLGSTVKGYTLAASSIATTDSVLLVY